MIERGMQGFAESTVVADEYILTHKVQVDYGHRDRALGGYQWKGSGCEPPTFRSSGKLDSGRICNYCRDKGNWKSKHESQSDHCPVKPVALSDPVCLTEEIFLNEKVETVVAVQQHAKPVAVAAHTVPYLLNFRFLLNIALSFPLKNTTRLT